MKNVLSILRHELRILLRNRTSLILLLVMPVAMIALLGYALDPMLHAESKGIEPFPVLYLNNDQGEIGRNFDQYLRGEAGRYFLLVAPESADVEAELLAKNLDEAIILPAALSESVNSGVKVKIQHVSSGENAVHDQVVRSALEGFAQMVSDRAAMTRVAAGQGVGQADVDQIQQALISWLGAGLIKNQQITEPSSASRLDSFQYFSAGMLIFFLLTSGIGLGVRIVDERAEGTFSRIRSFPVTSGQYLLGKALGTATLGLSQATAVIAFTTLVFHVNWGQNFLGLEMVALLVVLASSGLAAICSSWLNSSKALSTALMAVYWTTAFVSGAFVPMPSFTSIAKFTVNKWAFASISGMMNAETWNTLLPGFLVLTMISLALWLLGVTMYRRRVEHE